MDAVDEVGLCDCRQSRRSAVLGPGNIVGDGELPGTFLLQGRMRARTLVLPLTGARRRLVAACPRR